MSEFRCGGQTAIVRPVNAPKVSDEAWGNYMFMRANPRGVLAERWVHHGGCGIWFNVLRDTVSHEILATYAIDAPPPELER
jgi:sarcosine oxidase subunit delta